MSYVFSKALNVTPEERERRKTLPPKWSTPNVPHHKVAPPVAAKPKTNTNSTSAPPSGSLHVSHEEPVKSSTTTNAVKDAFRKTSLPARSYSVDLDFGPKMGGAFARLQAKLEQEPESKAGLYTDVYEAYKIKRSLKEHGVLPANMRSNEQLRKYSLDKEGPPSVMPKPRRNSAEGKRDVFARNRSQTTPTSPTIIVFDDETETEPPVFDEKEELLSSTSIKSEFEVSKTDQTGKSEVQTLSSPAAQTAEIGADESNGSSCVQSSTSSSAEYEFIENQPKQSTPFGDRDEITRLEEAPEVLVMKEEIAQERSKLQEGKQSLSDTINELERVDFGFGEKVEDETFGQPAKPSFVSEQVGSLQQEEQAKSNTSKLQKSDISREYSSPVNLEQQHESSECGSEPNLDVTEEGVVKNVENREPEIASETVESTSTKTNNDEVSMEKQLYEKLDNKQPIDIHDKKNDQKGAEVVPEIQTEERKSKETQDIAQIDQQQLYEESSEIANSWESEISGPFPLNVNKETSMEEQNVNSEKNVVDTESQTAVQEVNSAYGSGNEQMRIGSTSMDVCSETSSSAISEIPAVPILSQSEEKQPELGEPVSVGIPDKENIQQAEAEQSAKATVDTTESTEPKDISSTVGEKTTKEETNLKVKKELPELSNGGNAEFEVSQIKTGCDPAQAESALECCSGESKDSSKSDISSGVTDAENEVTPADVSANNPQEQTTDEATLNITKVTGWNASGKTVDETKQIVHANPCSADIERETMEISVKPLEIVSNHDHNVDQAIKEVQNVANVNKMEIIESETDSKTEQSDYKKTDVSSIEESEKEEQLDANSSVES